jgi:hypothetical protein
MITEMVKVWPQNFYTGYVASMCDIREKELLFLENADKRERAVNEFKQAVLACVKRNAARAKRAALSEQPASAVSPKESSEQKNVVQASNNVAGDNANFHPLKRTRSEEELKEKLKKQRADAELDPDSNEANPSESLKRAAEEEIQRYLKVDEIRGADPLVWWRNNRKSFPLIAQLAQELLAVPASSAGAERIFKALAHALSKRRRRLYDHRAESMVFVHENREHFAPEIWKIEQKRQKEKEKQESERAGDPDPSLETD